MKIFKIIFFIILVCLYNQGTAQNLQIDNVQANLGDTASVPINISNIDSLGSITLFISYDTTKVNFINYSNLNPHITGVMINDMHNLSNNARLGKIAISWSDINSISFNTEIFVVFHFKVLVGNYCPLIFLPDCELANYNGQIININYINGGISVTGSSISDNDLLDFKIYPNPTNEVILVELGFLNEKSELQFCNLQGKTIYSEFIYNNTNHLIKEINLKTYPKGIYFVKIKNNKFVRVEKFVLQ